MKKPYLPLSFFSVNRNQRDMIAGIWLLLNKISRCFGIEQIKNKRYCPLYLLLDAFFCITADQRPVKCF